MLVKPKVICPNCDAVFKGDVCPHCGEVLDKSLIKAEVPEGSVVEQKNIANLEKEKTGEKSNAVVGISAITMTQLADEKGKEPVTEPVEESENKIESGEGVKADEFEKIQTEAIESKGEKTAEEELPEVQSIFVDIAKAGESEVNIKDFLFEAKRSKLLPIILFLAFVVIGLFSFWRFIYLTPDYVSPLVLSAAEVKKLSEDERNGVVAGDLAGGDKVLPLTLTLAEGNFEQSKYAQFAPPDIDMLIVMFGIKDLFSRFLEEGALEKLKEEFDFSEDDIDVYLSKGFAIIYPEEDFNKWGFVVKVDDNAKLFIQERIKKLEADKEAQKGDYKDYYSELVVISDTGNLSTFGKEDIVVLDEEVEKDENATEEVSEEDIEENSDEGEDALSAGEVAGEFSEGAKEKVVVPGAYLLASNNKEFIDQMKESAEGNLPNLVDELKYTKVKANLPLFGQVFVYKLTDTPLWNRFIETLAPKIDYVGLEKVLSGLDEDGFVVYTKDNKLKIVTPEAESP